MSRKNRGRVAGLIEGFSAGMQMGQMVRGGMKQRELAEAGQLNPTGQMAEAATEDVQAQIDSGAGMGEARNLASPGRQAATPADTGAARRAAQLGVLEKYGDFDGANRLRAQDQQIALGQQQIEESKKRSAREDKVFSRQEKAWSDEDAYKADREAAFAGSAWGTKSRAYFAAANDYQAKKAEYDARVAAGDTAAVAPIEPAKPVFSMGESMLDRATALAVEVKHGRASSDQLMQFADMQKKVLDEGYIRAARMAQSGAPLTQVVAAFNAGGEQKIDPAAITEDKTVDRGNGVKTRLITFKRPDGSLQTIDTLADLDALGKAGDIFERSYKDHSMRVQDQQLKISQGQLGVAQAAGARAAAADGRAAAEFAAGAPERQLRQTVAGLQLDQLGDDPAKAAGAKAKLDAVGKGLGSTDKDQPSEVKLAAAMVKAGLAPDMKSGLQMALTRKGDSPEEMHKEFVAASMKTGLVKAADAVAQADEVMTAMGYSKKGGKWAGGGGDAAAGSKPASEGDAMSQAKAAIAAGADPAEVNKRLKAWGFKAL